MNRFIVILIVLFSSIALHAHPLKMTTGQLYIDDESQKCMLRINLFADDFSAYLSDIYFTPLTQENIADTVYNPLLMDYLKKNIYVFGNEKEAALHLVDATLIEGNVLQVSMMVAEINILPDVEIKLVNTLLFSAFDNQMNILHVELNASKEVVRFTSISPSYTFSL